MALQFRTTQIKNGESGTMEFDHAVAHAYAVLGGFSVGYGGDDHFVKALTASLDEPRGHDNGAVTVSVVATLTDASGHTGNGTIYALGIGQSADDPTVFHAHHWKANQGGQVKLELARQRAPLDRAWVFVRGFTVSYGRHDHHVQTLAIDAGNATLAASSVAVKDDGDSYTWTITFTPSLVMKDASGNAQNDASALDLLIMACPQPA